MRYLRMLTNAVAGGVLIATYLVVLVLQLNPHVSIASETAWRWLVALVSLYAPFLSLGIYFLLVSRELLGTESLRPAWLSVRLLAWLSTMGVAGAAAITWANLEVFRSVLTAGAAERMREGAVATTICAVVLLVTVVLRVPRSADGAVGRRACCWLYRYSGRWPPRSGFGGPASRRCPRRGGHDPAGKRASDRACGSYCSTARRSG